MMTDPIWTFYDHDIYPPSNFDSPECVVVTEGGYYVFETESIEYAQDFIYDFYEVPESKRDYLV